MSNQDRLSTDALNARINQLVKQRNDALDLNCVQAGEIAELKVSLDKASQLLAANTAENKEEGTDGTKEKTG